MKRLAVLTPLLLACIVACNKSAPTTPVPAIKVPPVIVAFTALPESLEFAAGQKSVLSWTVTGATAVTIDQGIGAVALTGTREVQPAADTTYVLTATNADGQATKAVTIKIMARAIFELVGYTKSKTSYGSCRITGTVKNVGNKAGYNVMITFTGYNASNIIIDTASGFPANLDTIPVATEAFFEAVFFNTKDWKVIKRLTWEISWLTPWGEILRQSGCLTPGE